MQFASVNTRVFSDLSASKMEEIGNIPNAVFSKIQGEHSVSFKLWVPMLKSVTHDAKGNYIKTLPVHISRSGLVITVSRRSAGGVALRVQLNAPLFSEDETSLMEDLESAIDVPALRSEILKAIARWHELGILFKREPVVAKKVNETLKKVFKGMDHVKIDEFAQAFRATVSQTV